MTKVTCSIDAITIENDSGIDVPSVAATCSRCGHTTESFGTSDYSIRRCLVLLNEECPNGENNFYEEENLSVI